MHSQVVARLSPALSTLVNGSFKEAVERQTDWTHVDVQTFLCFLQYVYRGSYDCLELTKLSDQELEAEMKQCWAASASLENGLTETNKSRARREALRDAYKSERIPTWLMSVVYSSQTPATSRFFNVLHTQVELFLIAHLYGISGLARLALKRSFEVLKTFDYSEKRGINDIHDLLCACYSRPTPEALRDIVARYVADNLQWLWSHLCIQTFSTEYSKFGRDVLNAIVKSQVGLAKDGK